MTKALKSQSDWSRIIAHADMDAFYASVEQLDDKQLRGKPIIVGPRNRRGVVLTASYEARPFGVGSAMPMVEAVRRCPQAIVVAPRFERYKQISKEIMKQFEKFSPTIEPISLDEAFIDMSGAQSIFGAPLEMGKQIKHAVLDATGLTISVGISATKYVAKVASAYHKPDGLTVIPAHQAQSWLAAMPVAKLWGAGEKTTKKLHRLGFQTIGDIAASNLELLESKLGKTGRHFFQLAHAQDSRSVQNKRSAKSIGSERTLSKDILLREDIEKHLQHSADIIARRLRSKGLLAQGIRIRLKTSDFQLLTRQTRVSEPLDTSEKLFTVAKKLVSELNHPGPFRLVGMATFDFSHVDASKQSDLFHADASRELETTIDNVIQRFGEHGVFRARDLERRREVFEQDVNLDFLNDTK